MATNVSAPFGPKPPPKSVVPGLNDLIWREISSYLTDPVDRVSLALVSREDFNFVTKAVRPTPQQGALPPQYDSLSQIVPPTTPQMNLYQVKPLTLSGPSNHERLMERLWTWMGKDKIFCGRFGDTNYVSIHDMAHHNGHETCQCEESLRRRRAELPNLNDLALQGADPARPADPIAHELQMRENLEYHRKYNEALQEILRQQRSYIDSYLDNHFQVD